MPRRRPDHDAPTPGKRPPQSEGRERYHHGDLRRALIDGATELVAERGPAALSLREAARRAGVSHAAPYRHFKSRSDLMAAVAERSFSELMIHLSAATAPPADGRAQLEALGESYVGFATERPALFRLIFDAAIDTTGAKGGDRSLLDVFRSAVARCAPRDDQTVDELAMLLLAELHGLATLAIEGRLGPAPPTTVTRNLIRRSAPLFFSGAGPARAAAPEGDRRT